MVCWAGIFHFIKMKVFTGCISCPAVVSLYENHFLPLRKLFSFTAVCGRNRYYYLQNLVPFSLLSGRVSHLRPCHRSAWGDGNRAGTAVLQVNITGSSGEGRWAGGGLQESQDLMMNMVLSGLRGLRCHLSVLGDVYSPASYSDSGI